MTDQEKRWLNNLKKAFYESDLFYQQSSDKCMEEICKAIDVAKTLRLSLKGEPFSHQNNKMKFVNFINLEIPDPNSGGLKISLLDTRSKKVKDYTFAELVYSVRCMIHENESLNATENADYHIKLDWQTDKSGRLGGRIFGDQAECNADAMWLRLREILAKFITGIDSKISFACDRSFNITISPELGEISPG